MLALWDAGLCTTGTGRRGPTRPARAKPAQRIAARRWLCGELDGEVSVSLVWCCDMLGVDAATLARVVRERGR